MKKFWERLFDMVVVFVALYLIYAVTMITICTIDPSCAVAFIRDRHVPSTRNSSAP